jgi:hypothetical protein
VRGHTVCALRLLFHWFFIHSSNKYFLDTYHCKTCARARDVDGTKGAPPLLQHEPPLTRKPKEHDGCQVVMVAPVRGGGDCLGEMTAQMKLELELESSG